MRNIILAFAERWNGDRHGTDPEIKIAAECLSLDHQPQVLVRGSDQAHIHEPIPYVPKSPKFLFFHDFQQLGLNVRIDVANLVEKDSATMTDLKQPGFGVNGPSERTLLMAKQLRLKELPRQPGAIEIDKRFFGAGAVLVKPGCQDALSAAGLPLNQYRALAIGHFGRGFGQTPDTPAFSEKWIEHYPAAASGIGQLFLLISGILKHLVHNHQQGGSLDRLGQALLRSTFNKRDTQFHRTKTSKNNDGNCGFELLESWDQIERRAVRQAEIEDGNIGPGCPKTLIRRSHVLSLLNQEPTGLQVGSIGATQVIVVFHQKNFSAHKRRRHTSVPDVRTLYGQRQ